MCKKLFAVFQTIMQKQNKTKQNKTKKQKQKQTQKQKQKQQQQQQQQKQKQQQQQQKHIFSVYIEGRLSKLRYASLLKAALLNYRNL